MVSEMFQSIVSVFNNFYNNSCPQAESIVYDKVKSAFGKNKGVAAGLIRIHIQDCFVRGCDASLLIDSTSDNIAEKDSPIITPSLYGFEIVDAVKAELEETCPGTVSCANILAFAARDSAKLAFPSGMTNWNVTGGRRDGRISRTKLTSPPTNMTKLAQMFVRNGLSQEDMGILLDGITTKSFQESNASNLIVSQKFSAAMSKLENIAVLTENEGEIRLNCRKINRNNTASYFLFPTKWISNHVTIINKWILINECYYFFLTELNCVYITCIASFELSYSTE